jgi:branched-chain amino acid transport system ATP-binding protein
MLRLNEVHVRYDDVVLALDGMSMVIPEGHIVALLGANGAGKSTTLKAISGLLHSEGGRVTSGTIELNGQDLAELDPADIVRLGVFHVMEGRRVFAHLSVEDNLRAGAFTRPARGVAEDLARIYAYFPRLKERRQLMAGYLSGGEQQMLAVGRALMARPRCVLLDEPSLGLAPLIVKDIFDVLRLINRESKTSILLVEQNARVALEVASYAYVLGNGRVMLEGEAHTLRANPAVQASYLGRRVAA